MSRTAWVVGIVVLLVVGIVLPLTAQDAAKDKAEAEAKAKAAESKKDGAEASKKDQPSAEEVLNELLRRRTENPLIEPSTTTPRSATPTPRPGDPIRTIAGTAPELPAGPLRPQGSLIISRRGRMIQASGGMTPWAFVFESDGPTMKDTPMFLMPCEELQQMEQIVQRKRDGVVLEVSGEVYVYRGVNYLLPTRVVESPNRGNLRP